MVCAERRFPNCDAASLAHAAREAVLYELERAGPRSFAELGISPAMATAAALDGGFATFEGKVSGFRTGAGGVFYETGYAIRKQEGGSIELQDFTSGKRNLLRTIAGTGEALERGTVDPQLRTDTTDLAALFPDRRRIYRLIQEVYRTRGRGSWRIRSEVAGRDFEPLGKAVFAGIGSPNARSRPLGPRDRSAISGVYRRERQSVE